MPGYRQLLARLGEAPAWLLSAVVHLGLLLIFASAVYSTGVTEPKLQITSVLDKVKVDQYSFETATVTAIGNKSPMNVASPSRALSSAVRSNPTARMTERIHEKIEINKIPASEMMVAASDVKLTAAFNAEGTTEHTGGVKGAIDRLTNEIAASLRQNETTVLWLFDASRSLRPRREAIADRFETIYNQLDEMGVLGEDRLQSVVACYAKNVQLLTEEPVSDSAVVAEAVRSIPSPDAGTEYVLTALGKVVHEFRGERTHERRNMMVIIVTDERGDDMELLGKRITILKRYGIKVYCVGNAAPLGQVEEYIPWTYKVKGKKYSQMLPVDRGPETAVPQRLVLPFWGKGPPKTLSSGYGPYGLTRLCAETGGLFLIVDEDSKSFNPKVMRNYAPDYRPPKVVMASIMKNAAKRALVKAAQLTGKEEFRQEIPTPDRVFPASSDTELRRALTEAQKPMAVVDYPLQNLAAILESGIEAREKLTDPRWRAAYDLAVGRVAAMRARAFGYNMVLAQMKTSPRPFERKDSNQWALKPSEKILGGPRVENLVEKAKKFLSRVVNEHPGTPWASLAARELATPMGWKWVEQNKLVERFGPRARDPEVARLLLAEAKKERKERKMKRSKKPKPPKL